MFTGMYIGEYVAYLLKRQETDSIKLSNERHPHAKLITIITVVACTISFTARIALLLFSQPVLLRTDLRLVRIAFDSRTKIISETTLRAEFLSVQLTLGIILGIVLHRERVAIKKLSECIPI